MPFTTIKPAPWIALFLLVAVAACSRPDAQTGWPVLKTYSGAYLNEVAMPLGGIGTGTVSLGGRGDLRDWEIMNRGALGYLPAFKLVLPTIANGPFFALYYRTPDTPGQVRVLEGPVSAKEHSGDWGADAVNSGFPRFESTTFEAAYPLAQVSFEHQNVPLEVRLEAFNPLLVGDAEQSGIPVAILRYVLANPTQDSVEAAVVGMVPNYIGADGWTGAPDRNVNSFRADGGIRGVYMTSDGVDSLDVNWGTMALATTASPVTYRTSWDPLAWNWTFREFWDDFIEDGELTDHPDTAHVIQTPPATLAAKVELAPGEARAITFMLTWHFPNRRAWDHGVHHAGEFGGPEIVGNYYTTLYEDAWDVAVRTASALDSLEAETVSFVRTLVDSDAPEVLKEAGLFNLNHLRSQTVFRTADGLPYGFEGTGSINGTKIGASRSSGWGFGTCFHVWNYESTVPFLFGDLSKRFREVEFVHSVNDDGAMSHRVGLPIELRARSFQRWAADGQMGTLIKVYRDWQLSGDDEMLRRMWPNIRKSMSFAWTGIWDQDKDGVMEGSQHNTMDINYLGPNPQMAGWYLGALRASEEMARYLGDDAFAQETKELFEQGSAWIDDNIFNGEYYEHHIPEGTSTVAQLGKGCLVDQLVGQYLAHTAGLGYLLSKENVQTTLRSIMKYNYIDNFNEHFNTFRSFGLGSEAGLLMASYPRGELLDFPFPYYTEIMTGFEYSTAAHMIYEGQEDAGLKVFRAIRDRYDGRKRNPFNEGEYGHRYSRAMAAWAGLLAYTGFQYSAVEDGMGFNPRPGTYFWSNGYQYGSVTIAGGGSQMSVELHPANGPIELNRLVLHGYGEAEFTDGRTFSQGEASTVVVERQEM